MPRVTKRRPRRRPAQARRKPGPKPAIQTPFKPRVNRKLKPILAEIGVPDDAPFVPDRFQVQAVEDLDRGDVVVSAPTGSGKTWIAEQAIAKALAQGQRAWYASPLKALSNSKYHDFGQLYGPGQVGILTGDRKENPQAPLIVGTTEILRNQLYDSMQQGSDLDAGLVVLDEAHFLGDPERGVVWEEVIIYLPVRVRLLLLSATVANAQQITRWLGYVRDQPASTVISDQRPVPLEPLFLMPDGEVTPLKGPRGLFAKVGHFLSSQDKHRPSQARQVMPPFGRILRALEATDLLPAIFFLKSRADCDAALGQVAGSRLARDQQAQQGLDQLLGDYLERYPFLADHPQLGTLRQLQVAAHHAGHLPPWKLVVERVMQQGLLKAIFSTSTVAAGVNFPARSVVITQSDRFNGREFVDLSATDLLQMTGRAGRRGMDNIGFCLVVPGPFQNVPLLAGLLEATPEPIESQLHINFSMVLNLLLSHRPAEIKQLLGMSLATFQRLERSQGRPRETGGLGRARKTLARELEGSSCPGPEEAVVRRRRRRQLGALRDRLAQEAESLAAQGGLWGALTRGRVFMDMYGGLNAVLRQEGQQAGRGVLAVSLSPERRLSKGRPRLDFVPLDEVAGVYRQVLDLPTSGGGRALAQAVLAQAPSQPATLTAPEMEAIGQDQMAQARLRLEAVDEELAAMDCRDCARAAECATPDSKLAQALDQAEALLALVAEESHAFWYDFVRHLEFLKSEGFVDAHGQLTQDGLWASKLRLDRPVLIAEAIRHQALPQEDPVLLAALLALFVDEREREGEERYLSQRLSDGAAALMGVLQPMLGRLRQWGFDIPPMPHSAASACFAWGLMSEFSDAVALHGGAEGDMAHLIYRTTDNLRQLATLSQTHPRLAACAREAVELLLRPPVVVPI